MPLDGRLLRKLQVFRERLDKTIVDHRAAEQKRGPRSSLVYDPLEIDPLLQRWTILRSELSTADPELADVPAPPLLDPSTYSTAYEGRGGYTNEAIARLQRDVEEAWTLATHSKVECPHCHNRTAPGMKCDLCGKLIDATPESTVAPNGAEHVEGWDLPPPTAAPHVEAARQVHLAALVLVGLLSLAAIATGIVALVLNSQGNTQFRFLGADLNTGSVGVACLGIGLISMVLIVRRVLKSVESLAALPPDRRD